MIVGNHPSETPRMNPAPRILKAAVAFISLALLAATSSSAAPSPRQLETSTLKLQLADGRLTLRDKSTRTPWCRDLKSLGAVIVAGKTYPLALDACQVGVEPPQVASKTKALTFLFHPLGSPDPKATPPVDNSLLIRIAVAPDRAGLDVSYQAGRQLREEKLILFEDILQAGADQHAAFVLPVREGLLVPCDSGKPFVENLDTFGYEGLHMRMFGLVRDGRTVLVSWDSPYIAVRLTSAVNAPAGQTIRAGVVLSPRASSLQLDFPGKGDFVTIGKAYRELARRKGLLVTLKDKIRDNPERRKLLGAANVKLWACLSRTMSDDSTREESSHVAWTFDEAAQLAEHLRNDLQLERVLFTLGGWTRRGYDNQHPDVMPPAPECGGPDALADCAARVMKLGYLFCLHDNYQDMYRDSPSWDESFLMKDRAGKPVVGGRWGGGRAFVICSQKAIELARRPQNLSAVFNLTHANAYFTDTTFAADLQQCFDPNHPLDRSSDIKWKQALCDYARSTFGVFGSEDGREWAVAHSDFFEGLTGVKGEYLHDGRLIERTGAVGVPLFEVVYRDCIALYGKYGYNCFEAAPYVLQHLSIGRPLNYHSMPEHLYWKDGRDVQPMGVWPSVAKFEPVGPRQFRITYRWQVARSPVEKWRVFVHFNDAQDRIQFQNDHDSAPATTQWKTPEVTDGPYLVTVPQGIEGEFTVRVGLYQLPLGPPKAMLEGPGAMTQRVLVGRLRVKGDEVTFEPEPQVTVKDTGDKAIFVHGEGGWAEKLPPIDRFIKNTHEILGPLNELTAETPLTGFVFLTADRTLRKSVFGKGLTAVTVVTNSGQARQYKSKYGGDVRLPTYGFVIESPTFVAFLAESWNGKTYGGPTLFTIRSLDGRPIRTSRKVRIYHGFGQDKLRLGQSELQIAREKTLMAN